MKTATMAFHVRLIGNLIDPESLFPLKGTPTNNCYCLNKPGEEFCDPYKFQSSETCTFYLLPGLRSVPAPSRRGCFGLEITAQHMWERGWVEGRGLACGMVDLGTPLCVFRRTLTSRGDTMVSCRSFCGVWMLYSIKHVCQSRSKTANCLSNFQRKCDSWSTQD